MSNLALPVSMKSFQRMVASVSPDITVCVRGGHAKGKSEGVYQSAALRFSDFYRDPANCRRAVEVLGSGLLSHGRASNKVSEWRYDLGMPIIERRLSQMTEGDIIGLPILEGNSTTFRPCDWLIQACEFPVVLFLDERNRALEGVKQAVFQLADSKAFYGHRLHPESIIVIAENIGDAYTVNQSDPAEISRAATVMLDPTKEEYLDYISGTCDGALVDFLRQNQRFIEHDGAFEPNKKYPDRRSWFKLDGELARLGLYDNPEDHMFYVLTGAFCGIEVAGAFKKFCAERDRQVSCEEILEDWEVAKRKLGRLSNEMYVELVSKLGDWLKKNDLNGDQAIELARFMHDSPPEPMMAMWMTLQKNIKNLTKVHPHVEQLMVRRTTGQDTSDLKVPAKTAKAATAPAAGGNAPPAAAPAPRKRGARR